MQKIEMALNSIQAAITRQEWMLILLVAGSMSLVSQVTTKTAGNQGSSAEPALVAITDRAQMAPLIQKLGDSHASDFKSEDLYSLSHAFQVQTDVSPGNDKHPLGSNTSLLQLRSSPIASFREDFNQDGTIDTISITLGSYPSIDVYTDVRGKKQEIFSTRYGYAPGNAAEVLKKLNYGKSFRKLLKEEPEIAWAGMGLSPWFHSRYFSAEVINELTGFKDISKALLRDSNFTYNGHRGRFTDKWEECVRSRSHYYMSEAAISAYEHRMGHTYQRVSRERLSDHPKEYSKVSIERRTVHIMKDRKGNILLDKGNAFSSLSDGELYDVFPIPKYTKEPATRNYDVRIGQLQIKYTEDDWRPCPDLSLHSRNFGGYYGLIGRIQGEHRSGIDIKSLSSCEVIRVKDSKGEIMYSLGVKH